MQPGKINIVQSGRVIGLSPLSGSGDAGIELTESNALMAIQQCNDEDLKKLLDQIETNKFWEDINLRKEFLKVLVGKLLGAKIGHDDSLAIRDLIFSHVQKISADELSDVRNVVAEVIRDSVERFSFGNFQPGCIRPSIQSAILNWRGSISADYFKRELTPLLLLPQLSFGEYKFLTSDSSETGINVYKTRQAGCLLITNGIDRGYTSTVNRTELEVVSSTSAHTHGYTHTIPSRDDLGHILRSVGVLGQDWLVTSINKGEGKIGCVAFFESDVGEFVRTYSLTLATGDRLPQEYLSFFYDRIPKDYTNSFDWGKIEDPTEVLSKLKRAGIVHRDEVL